MNLFLGDEVSLVRGGVWVTGRVNGIRLSKGHLELVSIEGLDMWFDLNTGWRFIEEQESVDVDDE